MIVGLLIAASTAAATPVAPALDSVVIEDAAHAIERGRLREAKLLIVRAITNGARGPVIDRLNASLAFASGRYVEALSGYQRLAGSAGTQQTDCEKGSIAALKLGRLGDAQGLIDCAVEGPGATWRAWNARGVLADDAREWATADDAFSRARNLAPDEASIVNNQGWSKLIRGDWAAAVPLFREAAELDPKSERIANNLELANAALAADLPQRRSGESDRDWAIRLNDAGVAAELLGDRQRAVAAFTRALDASPSWYGRASNNLQAVVQN
jgi:tetratricopeptide (TPR) repeat protein